MIEEVITVAELNEIADYINDVNLTTALAYIVKMHEKPDVPPQKVATLIVELQAYASDFKLRGKFYMLLASKNADASKKKNIYLSTAEALEKLVDSIKYLAKATS